MIKGRWPTDPPPRSAAEAANRELCGEYVRWLDEQRGLAAGTIRGLVDEARRFLSWYDERFASCDLQALTIADVDAYLKTRAPSLRRVTRKKVALDLRSFLRFAHAAGRVSRDFSSCVTMPMLYAYESIPSVLSPQQIDAVVRTCHGDRSPKGLRDHAIVLLLTTYGLRAGEIARLRLDDVDWRADRLRIRHSKTGSQSMLPLLPTVGAALLAYLRRGRPKTDAREFFVRERAPYCGLTNFYATLGRRLEAAGVRPAGKRGPHAFRHARAVGLLRSGVPPKIISDVLGHRSPESVRPYLKLATKELRDVALEIRDLVGEDSK
jgi:site-specific recombinase XerD